MRHLTIPTALIAGCLIAGSSWAQSSSSTSSGSSSGTSSTAAPPPGSEGSTGGSTDPVTTGGVSGINRLQPGERSAISPTAREEELFREGEQLEQKAREGICSTCGVQP